MDAQPTDPRTDRHLQTLQELTELGMALARAVAAQAVEAGPEHAAHLTLAFARVSRSVRQTVALEARLVRDSQKALSQQADRHRRETLIRADAHKLRVRTLVERAIDAEASGSDAENLLSDLDEHLEDADDLAGFADRPIPEIVARICRDLGVEPPPPSLWDDLPDTAPRQLALVPAGQAAVAPDRRPSASMEQEPGRWRGRGGDGGP